MVQHMFAVDEVELLQVFQGSKPLRLQLGDVIRVVQRLQDRFVASLGSSILLFEVVQQVAHTQTVTADLVRIGRADALAGRTDFALALGSFVSRIQDPVCRQDQVSLFGNIQLFRQIVSTGSQCLGLLLEQERIQNDTVADHVHLATLEDSGRNGTQYIFFTFEFQRMTGIRSTLETSDHIIIRGQDIDYFAFAFVAPL